MRSTIVLVLVFLVLSACGKNVSFDTLETARTQARLNASWNAQRFRQTDPRFANTDIVVRGDSTQDIGCPQGDGWASVDYIARDTGVSYAAKCSTVSAAVGCMTQTDFEHKRYNEEDGHCQSIDKVPFPFRKIHE